MGIDTWIPGACWPPSAAESVSPKFREMLSQKKKKRVGKQLRKTPAVDLSPSNSHAHTCICTYMKMYPRIYHMSKMRRRRKERSGGGEKELSAPDSNTVWKSLMDENQLPKVDDAVRPRGDTGQWCLCNLLGAVFGEAGGCFLHTKA